MTGNVSVNSKSATATTVIPQASEKVSKEGVNFNNLLKGKIEKENCDSSLNLKDNASKLEENNISSGDGLLLDQVMATVTTAADEKSSSDGDINLDEIINSLGALLDVIKNNVAVANLQKQENSNLNNEAKILGNLKISSILMENKNLVQPQVLSENINELKKTLGELVENIKDNISDDKEKLTVVEGLLTELDINLQKLTDKVKDQNSFENIEAEEKATEIPKVKDVVVAEVMSREIPKVTAEAITEANVKEISAVNVELKTKASSKEISEVKAEDMNGVVNIEIPKIQAKAMTEDKSMDIFQPKPEVDSEVNTTTTTNNNTSANTIINRQAKSPINIEVNTTREVTKGQVSTNEISIDGSKVQELQTLVNKVETEISKLVEVIKNPLKNEVVKVTNTETEIVQFKLTQKFSLEGDATKNNSSKKDQDSKGSIVKEDDLLNSILKGKDELPVNRFNIASNNLSTGQIVNQTEVQSLNRETMVNDVIKTVKYMASNSVKELVVKINPKELGEVLISLVQEDGVMKASIKASSKDTYNLLAQNLNELKKNIAEQNIKIQGVDISLNQDMGNYNSDSFSSSAFQGREGDNRFRGNYRNNSEVGTDEENEEGYYDEEIGNLNMLV